MNSNCGMNKSELNVNDVGTSHIRSFLDFCKITAVLIIILFVGLAIISFVTANEEHTGISVSGRTYTYSEVNGAKIGTGIGYLFGGFISGIFLWKFSEVFCGFLYDVKVIRKEIKNENRKEYKEENLAEHEKEDCIGREKEDHSGYEKEDCIGYVNKYAINCNASATNIELQDNTIGIGKGAFSHCEKLTSITIPDGVASIGEKAFEYCSSLVSITIPSRVATIGKGAFSYCSNLASITIPNGITSIEEGMFSYCKSLAIITIPSSVTSIGDSAFYRCESLTSITIPNNVTSIGEFALSGCNNLTQIVVTRGNSVYHSAGNCLIDSKSKILVVGCKSSILPADGSVMGIGDYAFYNCSNLTNILIPSSVKSIGVAAFSGCNKLMNVTIPSSVVSIECSAFCNWQSSQTIYCQATSQPSSWDPDWNDECYAKIVWGA